MERIQQTLWNLQQGRQVFSMSWEAAKPWLANGHRLHLMLRDETRSLAQNSLMWSCLTDISEQVEWCGKRLTPAGWKDWITGHLEGQELIPNMHGTGFISVNRGKSTSSMTIKEMTAVIDLCHAFGTERGVQWSKTSIGVEHQ